MSAYDNDPRVTSKSRSKTAFSVDLTANGFTQPGLVWMRGDGTWVASREQGSYRDFGTVDKAIHSLIGEPR